MSQMINLKVLGLTFLLFLNLNLKGQSENESSLINYLDERDKNNAYLFDVHYEMKYFNQEDTSNYHANVQIVRQPDDSIFGAQLWIELDSLIFAYDTKKLYRIDKLAATYESYDPVESPYRWIRSTWVNNFVEYGFITKNQGFRDVFSNPAIRTVVVDTVISGLVCKGYYLHLPDEEEFTNQYAFIAIDTNEKLLRRRVTSVWFQENEQYSAWTFHNPIYSQQSTIDKFDEDFLQAYKRIEEYGSKPMDTIEQRSIDYSSLAGKIMGKEQLIQLKDVKADIILLDFWYSACYPCIKSIPEVNKLYNKFKDKQVKVFGVNLVDDEVKSKSRMEKYVRNNPMAYETIMADGNLYASWVHSGYPMLLVLDKHYKLLHEHSGFSESMAEELTTLIEGHLAE